MAEFDTETEGQNREANGQPTHAFHRCKQATGKAKSMKKPEEESDPEPGGAAAASGPEDILRGDEDDAGGDHRLDNPTRQPNHI